MARAKQKAAQANGQTILVSGRVSTLGRSVALLAGVTLYIVTHPGLLRRRLPAACSSMQATTRPELQARVGASIGWWKAKCEIRAGREDQCDVVVVRQKWASQSSLVLTGWHCLRLNAELPQSKDTRSPGSGSCLVIGPHDTLSHGDLEARCGADFTASVGAYTPHRRVPMDTGHVP